MFAAPRGPVRLILLLGVLAAGGGGAAPAGAEEQQCGDVGLELLITTAADMERALSGALSASMLAAELVALTVTLERLSDCPGVLGRRALYYLARAEQEGGHRDSAIAALDRLDLRAPPKEEAEAAAELRRLIRDSPGTSPVESRDDAKEGGNPAAASPLLTAARAGVRLLSSDVDAADCEALWQARNWIYGRHGYAFTSDRARSYFETQAGYRRDESVTAKNIGERLTPTDIESRDRIVAAEEARHCSGASFNAPGSQRAGFRVPAWVICHSALARESDARDEATRLRDSGYPAGYLWIPDFGSLSGARYFLVYVGPFGTRHEAEVELGPFRREFNKDAYGVKVDRTGPREEFGR